MSSETLKDKIAKSIEVPVMWHNMPVMSFDQAIKILREGGKVQLAEEKNPYIFHISKGQLYYDQVPGPISSIDTDIILNSKFIKL